MANGNGKFIYQIPSRHGAVKPEASKAAKPGTYEWFIESSVETLEQRKQQLIEEVRGILDCLDSSDNETSARLTSIIVIAGQIDCHHGWIRRKKEEQLRQEQSAKKEGGNNDKGK